MTTPHQQSDLEAIPPQWVRLLRLAKIPDRLRLARYEKSPEFGPKILFFSGGSALNPLCRRLIDYTHNSIHLITPFDSGGSSAVLRKAFNMLAVGDLRNRLMALADQSIKGQPAVFDLFAYRFPRDVEPDLLRHRLSRMVDGHDPAIARIVDPLRKLIRNHLRYFVNEMPADFDLRGASIGNLILVGGYLNNERLIDPVAFLFSQLVEVRGVVRPTVGQDMHLAAKLADGSIIAGQHLLTGKEAPPLNAPIEELHLIDRLNNPQTTHVDAKEKVQQLINKADLVCYPMGSFYSSVVANLLPFGIGQAIADNGNAKVYIPNTGMDPEQIGMTVSSCVQRLLHYARLSCTQKTEDSRLLNFVLVDSNTDAYVTPLDLAETKKLGVEVIDAPLVTQASYPNLDPDRLISVLLSLT